MSGKRYKRFYVSESENQLIIYDDGGLDDYYHLGNDERDVKEICKLLNEQQNLIGLLSATNNEQYEQIQKLNAFLVEKGLELEFVKWCRR